MITESDFNSCLTEIIQSKLSDLYTPKINNSAFILYHDPEFIFTKGSYPSINLLELKDDTPTVEYDKNDNLYNLVVSNSTTFQRVIKYKVQNNIKLGLYYLMMTNKAYLFNGIVFTKNSQQVAYFGNKDIPTDDKNEHYYITCDSELIDKYVNLMLYKYKLNRELREMDTVINRLNTGTYQYQYEIDTKFCSYILLSIVVIVGITVVLTRK